ncbi:MAG: hypothetical protein ACI4T9_10695 [Prevotella sp.]
MKRKVFFGTPPECNARPYCGKDGLMRFMEHLHHHYYYEVIVKNHSYDLFIEQFLSSHKHLDETDATCKNEHARNLNSISFLLKRRRDLVGKYLSTSNSLDDYNNLWTELKTEAPEAEAYKRPFCAPCGIEERNDATAPSVSNPFEYHLANGAFDVLAEGLNTAKVFMRPVNTDTLTQLFDGSLQKPLVVLNTRRLSYFFHLLKRENFICRNWQKVIEDTRMFFKRDGITPLTAKDISPALYSVTCGKEKAPYQNIMEGIVNRIKKYYPYR